VSKEVGEDKGNFMYYALTMPPVLAQIVLVTFSKSLGGSERASGFIQ